MCCFVKHPCLTYDTVGVDEADETNREPPETDKDTFHFVRVARCFGSNGVTVK